MIHHTHGVLDWYITWPESMQCRTLKKLTRSFRLFSFSSPTSCCFCIRSLCASTRQWYLVRILSMSGYSLLYSDWTRFRNVWYCSSVQNTLPYQLQHTNCIQAHAYFEQLHAEEKSTCAAGMSSGLNEPRFLVPFALAAWFLHSLDDQPGDASPRFPARMWRRSVKKRLQHY